MSTIWISNIKRVGERKTVTNPVSFLQHLSNDNWHFYSKMISLRAASQWCEVYDDIDIGLNTRLKFLLSR